MKKSILAMALMALGFNAWGMGAADPAIWATQSDQAAPATQALFAGSAPIEQALALIVPAPWQIDLDSRVSATQTMSWPSTNNWVTALQAACAKMGLVAHIDRATQTVEVEEMSLPAAAPAAPAQKPSKAKSAVAAQAPHASASAAVVTAARDHQATPGVVGANERSWQQVIHGGGPAPLTSALLSIMPPNWPWQNTEIVGVNDGVAVSWARLETLRP